MCQVLGSSVFPCVRLVSRIYWAAEMIRVALELLTAWCNQTYISARTTT